MSSYLDLPASAVRMFKKPPSVGFSGLVTPAQKATAKATWRVTNGDFLSFASIVYGLPETVGGFNGAVIRRVPLKYPEHPGLLATDMTATAYGWNSTAIAKTHTAGFWNYWDCEVSFASPVYDLSGQNAYMSISRSPSTRPFPGVASGFRINGQAPIFDPGEEVMGEEINVTTHQLASYPLAIYDLCRDCVNSTTFDGRPEGTILYHGPSSVQTSNLDGAQTWEVTHQFTYSPVPWNYYFVNGVQYEMTRVGGTRKYIETDLTAIFNA